MNSKRQHTSSLPTLDMNQSPDLSNFKFSELLEETSRRLNSNNAENISPQIDINLLVSYLKQLQPPDKAPIPSKNKKVRKHRK